MAKPPLRQRIAEKQMQSEVPERILKNIHTNMAHLVYIFRTTDSFGVFDFVLTVMWPFRPRRRPTYGIMKSLEGLLLHAATLEYGFGIPVDGGAPIPVKKFIHSETGYHSYAATFPLVEVDNGSTIRLYAPYKGIWAPAEIRGGKVVVIDTDRDGFVYDISRARNIIKLLPVRGDPYEIYYDYLRLGLRPPRSILGYIINEQRGPLKLFFDEVPTLVGRVHYLAALVSLDGVKTEARKLVERRFAGYGYRHMGAILSIEESILVPGRLPKPHEFLLAETESGEGYVLLRPLPANFWSPADVVYSFGLEAVFRNAPPYYYRNTGSGTVQTLHFLPGTVVSEVPELEYYSG